MILKLWKAPRWGKAYFFINSFSEVKNRRRNKADRFAGLTREKLITFYAGNKKKNYVLISVLNFKTHHFSKPLPTSTFLQFTKPAHFKTSKQERQNYGNTWKFTSLNSIKEKIPTLAWNKNPAYPSTKATTLNRTTCPPSFHVYFPEKHFFLPVIGSERSVCGCGHFTYQVPQIKTKRTNPES